LKICHLYQTHRQLDRDRQLNLDDHLDVLLADHQLVHLYLAQNHLDDYHQHRPDEVRRNRYQQDGHHEDRRNHLGDHRQDEVRDLRPDEVRDLRLDEVHLDDHLLDEFHLVALDAVHLELHLRDDQQLVQKDYYLVALDAVQIRMDYYLDVDHLVAHLVRDVVH
jgi:hypothetical protein